MQSFTRVLAPVELIGGILAGLWGLADVIRMIAVETAIPSCVVTSHGCVSDPTGTTLFDSVLVAVCLLPGAGAYAHTRLDRTPGLIGLWVVSIVFYVAGTFSWGSLFSVPFLLALVAAVHGTLRWDLPSGVNRAEVAQ